MIDIIFDETSGTHLKTFLSLIEHIQPKDDMNDSGQGRGGIGIKADI